jgi:hypothetical protein
LYSISSFEVHYDKGSDNHHNAQRDTDVLQSPLTLALGYFFEETVDGKPVSLPRAY